MNHIFKKVSISLLILGGAFYIMTGAESITAGRGRILPGPRQ